MWVSFHASLSQHRLNPQPVRFSAKSIQLDPAVIAFQKALHQVENLQVEDKNERVYGTLPASEDPKRTQPIKFVLSPTCLKLDQAMYDITPAHYAVMAGRLKDLAALQQQTPLQRVLKHLHRAKVTGDDKALRGSYHHELSWWPRCTWRGGENAEFVFQKDGTAHKLTLDGKTQVLTPKEAGHLFRMLRRRAWQTPDSIVLHTLGVPIGRPTFHAFLDKLTKGVQTDRIAYNFHFSDGLYTGQYDKGTHAGPLKELQFTIGTGKDRERVNLKILEPQKRYVLETPCGEFEIPTTEVPRANALLAATIAKSHTQVERAAG